MPLLHTPERVLKRDAEQQALEPKLRLGTYLLKNHPLVGFYLEKIEDFTIPKKLYGDYSDIQYWKKSYESNPRNLGILLTGLKGTGKTIEAKKLCLEMQKPVIILETPYTDENFIQFLSSPEFHDCIIFIDEFEKKYSGESIAPLLGLFDGVYNTKFMFVLTANKNTISEYLINRLGRIKYKKEYTNLDDQIIEEVVEDLCHYPEHRDSIRAFFTSFGMCTFDLLTTVIQDVNLFNQSAFECAKRMCLEAQDQSWAVQETLNGIKLASGFWEGQLDDLFSGPVDEDIEFQYYRLLDKDLPATYEYNKQRSNAYSQFQAQQDQKPPSLSDLPKSAESELKFTPYNQWLAENSKLPLIPEEPCGDLMETGYNEMTFSRQQIKLTKAGNIVLTRKIGDLDHQIVLTKRVRKYTNYSMAY